MRATAHYSTQKENKKMSTPTTETLNGGSSMVPEQTTAEPNVASEGQRLKTDATGMNVGSQVSPTVIKNVGARTISGSHAGSVPAPNTGAGLTDFAKNAPGPRDAARQFKGSKFESDAAPGSTENLEGIGG